MLCFIAATTLQLTDLPPHGANGIIHFALEVERKDYEKTLHEISRQNITILHEQTWPNETRSFYFNDPDNNLVEVVEKGLWN